MLKRTLRCKGGFQQTGNSAPPGGHGRGNVQHASGEQGPPSYQEKQKTLQMHPPDHDVRRDVLYKGKLPMDQREQLPFTSGIKQWSNSDRRELFHGTWKLTPGWFDRTWEPPLLKAVRWYVPHLKKSGYNLVKWGSIFTCDLPSESLHRLRRIVTFGGSRPNVRDNAFVAPSAVVIGDVTVGRKCTVGYNTIVRGDLGHVEIGESSTINDKAVVIGPSFIGKWSTIDPMCVVDQAIVHSCSFVGSGTILGRGSVIESGSLLCAASILNPGTVVPSGEIWSGQPAQYLGKASEEEQEYIIKAAKHMVLVNLEHNDGFELTWEELEDIRIGREFWSMWAQMMYEQRVKPFYVRDGPRVNRQTGRDALSPCERYEGRLGMEWESNQPPHLTPTNW